jgi:hypothetical protein
MLTELKQIIASANAAYIVEYEEASMMNIAADEIKRDQPWAYIEEFVQGNYAKKMGNTKTTQTQVYFCRFAEMQCTAEQREAIRAQIEAEIVIPFMAKYNSSGLFSHVDVFKFFTPLPRFDANEISIMLQFDCTKRLC